MCNLYRFEPAQYAFNFKTHPNVGNLGPDYVSRDKNGPVLRQTDDGYEMKVMRWGFPPFRVRTKDGKRYMPPISNIRNLGENWWKNVNRKWLTEPEYRCLVPFEQLAEPIPKDDGGGTAWFETTTEYSFFAGVWRPWSGDTRLVPVEGEPKQKRVQADLELFAFLTTEANGVVAPIHEHAMPVIVTEQDEIDTWMAGGDPAVLQRPLPDELLRRVDPPG